MKRTTLIMLLFAMLAVAGGSLAASAGHCGTSNGHDPFGSCENGTPGTVECDESPDATVPMIGVLSTPSNSAHKGVEACADNNSALPIAGRVGVFVDANNNVVVFADGDDVVNSGGGAAWDRVDVRPNDASCKVRVRRGNAGQWSNNTSGGTTSSAEINQCVG